MIKKVSERIKLNMPELNVLTDVLDTLRFRGNIFFRSPLAAPWGMSMERVNYPRFHIAFNGDFYISAESPDSNVIPVNHMDIVMLPHGDMHWIADQTGRKLRTSEDATNACQLGIPLFQQGEITHHVICGLLRYDEDMLHPILDSLPTVMHFSRIDHNDPVWMTVMLIEAEMQHMHSHSSVIDRLTEVLFVQLLNKYMTENGVIKGFFAALKDHRLHHILKLIHQQPELQWTLDSLGKQAGLSRASLVRHFKQTIGLPPMAYITNWRMIKASHMLKYSSCSTEQIAEKVGFSSARSLSKAFLRHFGYTPGKVRRNQNK